MELPHALHGLSGQSGSATGFAMAHHRQVATQQGGGAPKSCTVFMLYLSDSHEV